MRVLLLFISLFISQITLAQLEGETITVQADSVTVNVLPISVVDGDTMPYHSFREFSVVAKSLEYRKNEYRVRKVYPYAMIASGLLEQFHLVLDTVQNKREKKKYVKAMKQALEDEFKDELKDLSVQQGIILMKLINRETGMTSYEIVKQFNGTASALMWQTTAKIYGSSMKQEYDPEGEDASIEQMLMMIESGELKVIERKPKTLLAKKSLAAKEKRAANRMKRRQKRRQKRADRKAN